MFLPVIDQLKVGDQSSEYNACNNNTYKPKQKQWKN